MGRGDYERLTPQAIDQLWVRMRAGSLGCVPGRCVATWCGAAGSDPIRDVGRRVG